MEMVQLEMTLDDIKWGIVNAKKLKVKQEVGASIVNVSIHWDQTIGFSPLQLFLAETGCDSTLMVPINTIDYVSSSDYCPRWSSR